MFWADKLASSIEGFQTVNDSKTPSGRVHVGSLRGVIIHDVIYRALKHANKSAQFLYGIDDYDPLDTVPRYLPKEKLSPFLGVPLCNVPSPAEGFESYAKYFINEFVEVFEYLGVSPEIYYVSDIYRSGKFNKSIDTFLRNRETIRKVYEEVSGGKRPDDWYPFQVVCEKCGKIATTVVTDYNGHEVYYVCKPDAATWVQGCGHSGWISPFDGNGKLPWKLEWVAKWDLFDVTIEMAGKDHSQKGGSRDVADAVCRKVLNRRPPFHSHYEFILVDGTKMSSSKGIGFSAKDVADLLPPEILRFLMLRTRPKTAINFSPNHETITRLFRDYDTLIAKYRQWISGTESDKKDIPEELMPLLYSQLDGKIEPYRSIDFSTIISLIQIPHLEVIEEVERRFDEPLDEYEQYIVNQRIDVARKWLENYANEEEKLTLYLDSIPKQSSSLTHEQISYLTKLLENLETVIDWDDEVIQSILFSVSKEIGIQYSVAFQAVYLSFLGKERGPKAGSLLSYLDKSFVVNRLRSVVNSVLQQRKVEIV